MPKKNEILDERRSEGGGYSFMTEKGWFLMKCHACKRENYALNVATGICTWCGWDDNKRDYETVQT